MSHPSKQQLIRNAAKRNARRKSAGTDGGGEGGTSGNWGGGATAGSEVSQTETTANNKEPKKAIINATTMIFFSLYFSKSMPEGIDITP